MRAPGSRAVLCALAAVASLCTGAPGAEARPLGEIRERGALTACANPNALPHASNRPEEPGFQIEIARALAAKMGLKLAIDWIVPRMRASTVDCDILLDTIVSKDIDYRGLRLSVPYQLSGVSLGIAPGQQPVQKFSDIPPDTRIGVMVNSLASVMIGKNGARTVPFAFEDEMVIATARGEVYACASSPASIGYYNLRNPQARLTLVHAEDHEPELRWPLAIGMRRADDALVAAIDAALLQLLDDGTIAGIYAKYGVEHRRPPKPAG
jgi:ABC-type amino acid transport substrate-binding protein